MLRDAIIADYPTLLDMAEEMHAESRFARFNFDRMKLTGVFDLARERGFFKVAEDKDRAIIGAMVAMAWEMWFGRDLQSSDMGLFVLPGKRGGIAAAQLVDAYVEWARSKGCAEIGIGTTTGVNTELAGRLYESRGFERVGAVYRMGA